MLKAMPADPLRDALSDKCSPLEGSIASRSHGEKTRDPDRTSQNHLGPMSSGACAMTTKFLNNKICTLISLLSWHFPRKPAFLENFLSTPTPKPPSKVQILFLLLSRSLSLSGYRGLSGLYPNKSQQNALSHSLYACSAEAYQRNFLLEGIELQGRYRRDILACRGGMGRSGLLSWILLPHLNSVKNKPGFL